MSSRGRRLCALGFIGMGAVAAVTVVLAAGSAEDTSRASCNAPIPGGGGLLAFGDIETRVNDWNRFLRRLDPKTGPARQIEAYRESKGLPVSLVPPKDLSTLPPGLSRVEDQDTPCGPDIVVFARSLDAKGLPGSGLLHGERVLEIDPQGRVLDRWTVPTSQTGVVAVRGASITVRSWAGSLCRLPDGEPRIEIDVWLVIRTDGSFKVVDPDPKMAEPERVTCRLPENFKESAYAACWRFKDLDSGAARILVFDAPCT